jgi:hypothetical protein
MCSRVCVARPALTLELAGLRGMISTQPFGFAIHLPFQEEPIGYVDWPAGGSDDYHRRVCTHLAHVWFGGGHGRRLRIREHLFTSAPSDGYLRWDWTRETRPVGHADIWVTDYLVFQAEHDLVAAVAHPFTLAPATSPGA